MYYSGQWGTVCNNGWDLNDAQVVCRQLNLGQALIIAPESFYGRSTGRIWLDNMNCLGYETSISKCSHAGWGNTGCSHAQEAGVYCSTSGMYM